MKAKVTYVSDRDGHEIIEVNNHKLQYGGSGGDGFCYGHQSFDCIDNLTEEEQEAINNAE